MTRKVLIPLLIFICYSVKGFTQDSAAVPKANVDTEYRASFPGGISAWNKYIADNIDFNVPYKNKAKKGKYRVVIRFAISKDGVVTDLNAETNFGYGMEEEAIRVLENSPKWNPAFQHGRFVNYYQRQPIVFIVD